ncbi:sensor histidine kinase [Rhizobium sp. LjRoot254]|uniref:sensor histidine kinase n=1 Tax=Rhizobium sp. LjRoot254 TaxID=3342297 RepID=UPI003ED0FBD2
MTRLEKQADFHSRPEPDARGADLGDTIFGVVHDLGNLIQVATSALNIVSRSPDMDMGSTVGTTISSARVSLQRAGTLVQQTMRFARYGDAAVEPVDVWACLVEIEALITATWGSEIRLELYAGRELPSVVCSRVGLQSAVMNLLLNAREAMPNGGAISVVATAIYEDHIATGLELRCSDTGLGMSEDVLRQASELYFTTKMSGLGGLGLPMVKRFAQEAGGQLHLESEPGRGTTATLRLPIPTLRGMTIDLCG